MFQTFCQNISIDKLRNDEKDISIVQNSSDFISYPEFLNYFSNIQEINKHHLIISINFTYGWMPTIFDFRSNEFDEVLVILNNSKKGQIPSAKELEVLKKCFNNSLVGASKLLHFINPTQFAIWDSRVFRYLTSTEPHSYRLDNFNSYLDYLKFCEFITNQKDYLEIHNSVNEKIGYEMTLYRTLELIMYLKGGR